MPTPIPLSELSDRVLLDSIAHAAADERHATVDLIRLLAELDARRLYLSEGCSSLFTYCTQVLHLSEHAAYHRIEAARALRAFPEVLDLLADGALTLTTVALLRAHLTAENHHELLAAARYKTKREVEDQIAGLAPRPDVKPLVRQVVDRPRSLDLLSPPADQTSAADALEVAALPVVQPPLAPVSPRSPGRYLLRVTISGETYLKLRQARDLLRHTIPDGDPAAILDRALTLLIQRLEREKAGMTSRPRAGRRVDERVRSRANSRHIPAAVRREVWVRDQGRCAFEGPQGRCRETGRLEFHHLVPFADGGPPEPSNISLRCRAHNSFESEQRFGPWSLTRP
jgi:5-methylcytosine-specific restriction endonuclease McrA